MPRIITNLWFDTEALAAAEYYCSVFPNSEVIRVAHNTEAGPGPAGSVVTVDHYWDTLSEGGETGRYGWLKDRYGLSWQVCPDELGGLLSDPDAARAERAFAAMLQMNKIDIASVRSAADGVDSP